MDNLLPFLASHSLLVIAFIVILALLVLTNKSADKAQGVSVLTPEAIVGLMNHEKAHVLDIRNEVAFKAGHLLGAQHMPVEQLNTQLKKLEKYKTTSLIIVGQAQADAVRTGSMLVKQGFSQVACLRGGISTWRDAGMPLVKS